MNISLLFLSFCAAVTPTVFDTSDPVTRPLFDFGKATSVEAWRPAHDRVMGGVSTGSPAWTEEGIRFSGEVSLENNGGFAGFRSAFAEPLDLSKFDGLRLRVRGDGHNWKVSIRTAEGRRAPNWQAPFQTRKDGEWQEVWLPFDAFAPSFRGRYARTEKPLDRKKIESFGLVVADGQAGEYSLDLASFEAWSLDADDAAPGSVAALMGRTKSLISELDKAPSGSATAEVLLGALRWSERVLVVSEPLDRGSYGKEASMQRGRLFAALPELAARDLRVVHLLGDQGAMVAGQQLGPEATRALREHWDIPQDDWSCALVGKDGGVKKRWKKLLEPEQAFEIIDVMPMRRGEATERSGK